MTAMRLFGLGLAALALAGCNPEPPKSPGAGAGAPSSADQPKLRPVIGRKTQDIRNMDAEVAAQPGQVNVASQKITARDPITLSGNAYVTMVGQIAIDQITHAMRLFEALEGRMPKDYDEFMERIIRENNIALPQLPGYQEYAYDEKEHRLVVLEYPDRHEALKEQVRNGANP